MLPTRLSCRRRVSLESLKGTCRGAAWATAAPLLDGTGGTAVSVSALMTLARLPDGQWCGCRGAMASIQPNTAPQARRRDAPQKLPSRACSATLPGSWESTGLKRHRIGGGTKLSGARSLRGTQGSWESTGLKRHRIGGGTKLSGARSLRGTQGKGSLRGTQGKGSLRGTQGKGSLA